MPSDGQFLFKNCVCIANTGGDATGAVTFNWLPPQKPKQCLLQECQLLNNKLNASSTYGGAGIHCTRTYDWMSGNKFITFCFFDGNAAANGRGNDVFFNGTSITQSPFNQCGSTTITQRVWNQGTADNVEYNGWLPLIAQNKIVSNSGIDMETCGRPQHTPCATIEYALNGFISHLQNTSLTLLNSIFIPSQTLTFSAVDTNITGNGTDTTIISSYGISQTSSSSSSLPDPSASSALFQQTQGSLTVSALAIAHNSSNPITPILFHLSENSPSLKLNTTTITGTASSSSSITTPLFFLTAGSLALNHTAITSLALNSQSIFHLTSLTAPLTLNSSSITDITSTSTPTSCVLSSATSPALSLSLANCTITSINSEQLSQQTPTNGGCISFASSAPANSFSVSDTNFSSCSVSEDTSSGGRGGALMIEYKDNSEVSESSFSITNIVFSANKASVGRDVYFVCDSLVASVKEPLFAFMRSITQKDNSIVGHDRTDMFNDWDADLFIFLEGYTADSVYVDGTSGMEKVYCGIEKAPCLNVNYGMGRLKRTLNIRQEIILCANSSVTGCLDVGGINVKAKEGAVVQVECKREVSGSEECIMKSTSLTEMEFIGIIVPSRFNRTITSVIESTTQNGELHMKNCAISVIGGKGSTIGFSLIRSTGKMVELDSVTISDVKSSVALFSISPSHGTVNEDEFRVKLLNCTMEACSLDDSSFCEYPLMISSSVLFESNNFSNIENKGSEEGGVAKVTLQGNEELVMKSTNASSCSLLKNNGKGGFLYLDCQNCLNEKPIFFESDLTFENNKATIGKNVFILGKDLNSSVANESFKFDYSSMKDDDNLFVGSDNYHQEKDLFMFLIPYSSFEIFISSEGFDVARCGSEEEPCFTMWKGMENMKEGDEMKTIQIEGSTIIRDSFNMSNYRIKKSVKMGEENVKAILNFEKSIGSQLEYFMKNDIHLELTNIQLRLSTGFDNSAKTIISNKNGNLVISGCSFHSEAGVNNGFDCVFVDAIGGSVEVNDLSMESCNIGNNIFVIHDAGVSCHFVNVRVDSLNESRGCLLQIKGSELATKINEGGEEMSLKIDNSSFSGVKRSDNGASILESKSEKNICLVVNESDITEDKVELSEKGGAIFFTLCSSGSMKMIDSTISHCSCTNGKGGGVYLVTKERGDLNFSFVGMKFSSNSARVGNDIFIECFNITLQINESQFQFDLREGHYTRHNAIYGIDSCEHTNDTDLINFVTIHQSDTIVVSRVNGSNERQCGTSTLPCASIDYGLMHLSSDFMSQMIVVGESVIGEEINLKEMSLSSKSRENCKVEVKSEIAKTKDALVTTIGTVSLVRVNFVFDSNFISQHESLISPEGGILEIMNCSFSSKKFIEEGNTGFANIRFHIINMEKGEFQLDGCTISNLVLHESALYLLSPLPSVIDSLTICNSTIETSLIDINECGQLNMEKYHSENITVEGNEESLISCLSMKKMMQLTNCTMDGVNSNKPKGKMMKLEDCIDVKMDNCIFDGSTKERNEQNLNEEEEMCRWEGSLVDIEKGSVMMKDTTISNSSSGGLSISAGNVTIEKGEFMNNNPFVEKYPSLRRNIICSDSASLTISSLKGGDGLMPNSSLWILNDGCTLGGISGERSSPFFIPKLEEASLIENDSNIAVKFNGALLLPCDLSFRLIFKTEDVELVETYPFDENSFVSEDEVIGTIPSENISTIADETEVSVMILFGKQLAATSPQILKNRSESKVNGDERISEGGKEGKSTWNLIVIVVMGVLFVIFMLIFVAVVVLLRKKLREAEKRVEKERLENEEIMGKIERRRKENNGGSFEMSEMQSTLLEGMTSQIPLLIDNDEEDLPDPPSMSNDGILNENDLPDLESSLPFSENASASGVHQNNSFNVISAKKPFREKEKRNIKALHSMIHSVQGYFTLGTRAMDVVDGKEVVLAVAELFEHLISVDDERVEMMGRQLCPYSIFVEEGNENEIYLLTEELTDEKQKEEMKRWNAPEAGDEEEGIEKAVVFSLGLILHEMTTGEVPLSECNAEEAQEMIRDGVRPLTEGIEGEDLVELMESMWADEPNNRPSLVEVKKSIKKIRRTM
ncbi:putative Protein tyrosine and serine/threonine kinase [Monocercomonoides exilis]|uniref:putative Protein tyrosine and serine/threonine kinase n=1 Tax=Monocercomonoides exilis TaxID=2049356 RepID=UPI00355A6111|nr:putative Protein tyrosine and serine/threonine kinase [Monocercomonoides exilis]|eukprot:MONOS_4832.1-p1 / transcript=MONOS_4832.1 / gene=MONOS_4832 / organism=Monocercomonoides_exilis_PA203 / gene_product=unspecified product / transcript_product=unspecified product / location=Mono_scaffold00134:66329-72580(-) / protein_length=2083 / sequence_SO=supercontig / SO=protein_coding / is_pseudo=false